MSARLDEPAKFFKLRPHNLACSDPVFEIHDLSTTAGVGPQQYCVQAFEYTSTKNGQPMLCLSTPPAVQICYLSRRRPSASSSSIFIERIFILECGQDPSEFLPTHECGLAPPGVNRIVGYKVALLFDLTIQPREVLLRKASDLG